MDERFKKSYQHPINQQSIYTEKPAMRVASQDQNGTPKSTALSANKIYIPSTLKNRESLNNLNTNTNNLEEKPKYVPVYTPSTHRNGSISGKFYTNDAFNSINPNNVSKPTELNVNNTSFNPFKKNLNNANQNQNTINSQNYKSVDNKNERIQIIEEPKPANETKIENKNKTENDHGKYENTNKKAELNLFPNEQIPELKPLTQKEVTEKIEKFYFIVNEKKGVQSTKKMKVNYLMSFKNWKISKEEKLIEDFLKTHKKQMSNFHDDNGKKLSMNPFSKKDKIEAPSVKSELNNKPSEIRNSEPNHPVQGKSDAFPRTQTSKDSTPNIQIQQSSVSQTLGLSSFARKNIDEDTKSAMDYKDKIGQIMKQDPTTIEITDCLNKLTLDNYDYVKSSIFELVRSDVVQQEKLIEVLFKKAIRERNYVVIYSKLCYELDKELPQRIEIVGKVDKTKRMSSVFRTKLLDKCMKIFKEDLSNLEKYIQVDDPDEKESKIKQFTLGNVNFIGELINTQILSKKVVFVCIEFLLENLSQINLEGTVILVDKFGTFINKQDTKLANGEKEELNGKIKTYIEKLDKINKEDKKLPGFIKYKIINLIEKRNRGWIESKVDESHKIKTKQEVGEEFDKELREKGGFVQRQTYKDDYNEDYYDEEYSRPAQVIEKKPEKEIIKNDEPEYIQGQVLKDFNSFRDHIEEGGEASEYTSNIINKLKERNPLGLILMAFGQCIVDSAGHPEDIDYCFNYIKLVLEIFIPSIKVEDKNELVTVTNDSLLLLSDYSLDNFFLTDIWGSILYLLITNKLFKWKDLEKLQDLVEEQLQIVMEVVCKAILYFEDSLQNSVYEEVLCNTNFKSNKNLFSTTWKNISSIK